MAAALPEVEWLEYSFQNLDHLLEQPVEITDGIAIAPNRPGHGLVLSDSARRLAEPLLKPPEQLDSAPHNPRIGRAGQIAPAP
jgi:L-alanine-DL-glutamate epimerase-like enolase superfamily enzyme